MLESLAIGVGILASVLGIIAFAWPKGARRYFGHHIVSRLRKRYRWRDVWPKIDKARDRVDILQTWIPDRQSHREHVRTVLRRGVAVRFLFCDQRLIPLRQKCRGHDRAEWKPTVEWVHALARDFNSDEELVQARFYKALPFGPIYRIDEWVYWGQYFAHQDSMKGPAHAVRASSTLGRMIANSYEALWESGSHRSGEVVLPGAEESTKDDKVPGKRASARDVIVRWIRELSGTLHRLDDWRPLGESLRNGGLVLIRHAATDLNEHGIISGDLDVSINASGRKRATELSGAFMDTKWDRIIASPARRTLETLRAIFGDKDFRPSPVQRNEVRERQMGDLEGLSKSTYKESVPRYEGVDCLRGFYEKPDGGERYADVFKRVRPLLTEVVEEILTSQAKVLVCTHQGPIQVAVMALEGVRPGKATGLEVGNAEVLCYVPRS